MHILPINRHRPSPAVLRQAAAILRRGGVVAYPTDTAYAIGGRFDRRAVARRVMAIKGRRDHKFTLVAASLRQAQRHFRLATAARRLIRRHWPGPLSLVVSKRYAVRVPADAVARRLATLAGVPLIATSANRTGRATPYTAAAVRRQFAHLPQPDLVLDAGRLPKRKPSTVVAVDGRGRVRVLRAGMVHPHTNHDISGRAKKVPGLPWASRGLRGS